MKIINLALGLAVMLSLAACSAGISAGSESFSSGPQGDRICGHSYDASVGIPGSSENGVHSRKGCLVSPPDDEY